MSRAHDRRILTINTGSSSLKAGVYSLGAVETAELAARAERIGRSESRLQITDAHGAPLFDQHGDLPDHSAALHALLAWLQDHSSGKELDAIGHRVVHGGDRYQEPQHITDDMIAALEQLVPLDPDHLPQALAAIQASRQVYRSIPQVACFDTTFHRHMPPVAQHYALPHELWHQGVRRYGFHGLSYESIMDALQTADPAAAGGRVIIAHLGNGASMAAVHRGIGVDTTMGLTPTGGLVMGTRSGDLDPGVLLYLLQAQGMSPTDINTLDACYAQIRAIQDDARANGVAECPRWPAIVLRTPKGWTRPQEVNGLPIAGTFRAHQVPLADVKSDPEQLAMFEEWMRSYGPEALFDANGRLSQELAALAPTGDRRMGANPHANGGKVLIDLDLPDFRGYVLAVRRPAVERHESTRQLGKLLRDTFTQNARQQNFRVFCPDEANSNRLNSMFEVEKRCFVGRTIDIDDHVAPDGRVMEVLSEHLCQGWLEGYLLSGRHGIFVTYESFAMVSASMAVQHTKWLEEGTKLPWRAPIASLNILLTSTCWRNDHNGFSHQAPA